ncbi:MAG TPA: RIP metalloprotease RseP [Ktedonobacterales bacterium]|nr:RIP metalloprotease RseP [Ktedonobacterales bacterium]
MISIPWYWYLAAIPVFGILVLVHEFGHFITAKWAGIRVDEFAIGFPPRLFGFKRGETMYSINLLPIGGYVRMPGENGETTNEQGQHDPRNFASKPASKRLIVLLAGVTMNLLFAIIFFTAAEAIGKVELRPVIANVVTDSPAQAAGLRPGDTFISIDGKQVKYFSDVQTFVNDDTQQAHAANKNATTTPVAVVVRHSDGSTLDVTINARINSKQGALGIEADQSDPYHFPAPLWKAPILGVQDVGAVMVATYHGIGQIVAGALPFNQAVQGPVGIVSTTGEVAASIPIVGPYVFLFLIGALNLSLAIMNLLPIPALDGGRVLLVLIEVLRRGKRLSPEREGLVNLIGMAAILLLVAVITFGDVTNLIGGR